VSIAEARTHLSGLVRDAERGATVEITRRGGSVAILISRARYDQLATGKESFGDALDAFLWATPIDHIGLEAGEFEDLRARDSGSTPTFRVT
jgi:prevent-host-death family protein